MLKNKAFNNILIIGSIGIGNLLLFRPTLQKIRDRYPQAKISLLVLRKSFAEIFTHDVLVDEMIIVDFKKNWTIRKKMQVIRDLRRKRFDLVITTFPANKFEYNVLAFLTGTSTRIAHSYPRKKLKSLSFLQNIRVPIDVTLHDVEQNLGLLNPLGITYDSSEIRIEMTLHDDDYTFSKGFLTQNNISKDRIIIGLHPGSSVEHRMIYKRWPHKHFANLMDTLFDTYNAQFLIFGGPGEGAVINAVVSHTHSNPILAKGLPLGQVAALIKTCNLFISNDSGLMHLATAVETKTIGLFGPADHLRVAPYGKEHRIVRSGIHCSPCWPLKDVGVRAPCIYETRRCMEELPVSKVYGVVEEMLQN